MNKAVKFYDAREELWNVITHGFGLALSVGALVMLVVYSSLYQSTWHIVSFSIYGSSLVILYLASTLYHSSKKMNIRYWLNIFDHSAIYLLIAGTYTPILLVTLRGPWGWSLFGVVWGIALVGIILKFVFPGKYDKFFTMTYVLMGWLAVIGIYPLVTTMAMVGLLWLLAGGLFYTFGAWFYIKEKINYNHVIFHVFVLLGSISHFVCVFFYV